MRLTVLALALVAFGGLAANPTPAAAAGMKVVVVVGPAGSSTSKYITSARRYASQARSYGANVVEIYSPNATWTRVKSAARGANVFLDQGIGKLVQVSNPALHHAIDRLDGLLAGDLAGRMTAHAVADNVKAEAIVEEERIFVRLSLTPYVGEACSGPPKRWLGGLVAHRHLLEASYDDSPIT